MKLAELKQELIADLKAAGISGAQTDAELILSHVLEKDRAWLLAHDDTELSPSTTQLVRALARRRTEREPLSYVLGVREFAGLSFAIDKRALTPRVETETIVAEVIKAAPKNATVLDIGTGSGAMAIALKHLRSDLIMTASEVSPDALELARKNAIRLLDRPDAINFVESDLFSNVPSRFDIIVANLPYVSREMELMPEVHNEPEIALFGGASDGLDLYRKFFAHVSNHLTQNAWVWTESDPWQQAAIIELAESAGLQKIFQDYFILGFRKVTS